MSVSQWDLDQHEGEIRVGSLSVDPGRFSATCNGTPLQLTNLEFRLLTLFSLNAGRVLRRDKIAREVWGGQASGRTIDIHVSRLRRQLPEGSIQTIVRVGYRMVSSVGATS